MTQNEKPTRKSREHQAPTYIAWHVDEKGKKSFWTRIGAAWRHEDGEGLTLQLDLVPVNGGRITLRVPKAADNEGAGA
ncbi:hypothetical protein CN213_06115 [Sinorhizobium meliloti]|uniref:hypothetical protein n=1 Tax=Rhizobium meliloti TaxID=382 RepID=UPI000FD8923C|nr:hypothetical protein [Sinorhizobium meliloti]RVH60078.1 hypothetical protein CN213_06115 [Sinorhizobium meliloti]